MLLAVVGSVNKVLANVTPLFYAICLYGYGSLN